MRLHLLLAPNPVKSVAARWFDEFQKNSGHGMACKVLTKDAGKVLCGSKLRVFKELLTSI